MVKKKDLRDEIRRLEASLDGMSGRVANLELRLNRLAIVLEEKGIYLPHFIFGRRVW